MMTEITAGISVTVSTKYRPDYSQPLDQKYLFSYRVTLENSGDHPVKLLRRRWFIFDSAGEFKEVDGEGVVGQNPILYPGDIYEYESACELSTDIGRMEGYYTFSRLTDNKMLKVAIPAFDLITPFRLN